MILTHKGKTEIVTAIFLTASNRLISPLPPWVYLMALYSNGYPSKPRLQLKETAPTEGLKPAAPWAWPPREEGRWSMR